MKHYRTLPFLVAIVMLCVLASGIAIAGKTSFVSTDFNRYSFDRTLWTLTNPRGDGGISMINTGTADAAVSIKTPAGVEHNLWTDGDNTVRILQAAQDSNFRLEVKFLSGLAGGTTAAYTAQGVLVEESATSKIEFCFTTGSSDTDSIYAYVATFIGGLGSPVTKVNRRIAGMGQYPLWMRVTRTGDVWVCSASVDGTTWETVTTFTQAMTVTKIGPYALNAGVSADNFSAVVDYFHNLDSIKVADDAGVAPADTIAPWIHSVRIVNNNLAPNAMRVGWCTDKLSDGVVRYGTTTAYGSNEYSLDMKVEHTALLTGLTPSTTYNYKVEAGDAGAHSSSTGNFTQATPATVADGSSYSDGFVDTTLNGDLWTLVDHRGDVLTAIANGQLAISVPGGVAHDLWSDGDYIARVAQTLPASNVREFVVKFNTGVSASGTTYRTEGMVFEQDATHLMRFEFLNSESNTKAFAATFPYGLEYPITRINVDVGIAGAAPIYMRVKQTGALWTMDYSFDGSGWTEAGSFYDFISPVSVGVSAGNAADVGFTPPENTVLADYFQGALPSKPKLGTPANDSLYVPLPVQLTWNVAINVTGYHVQVARDSLFTMMVANDSSLTVPVKNLTGLQSDTKYYWRVKGKNAKGSGLFSAVWKFTTVPGVPGAPQLLSPASGTTNLAVSQTLRWSKVASAISYHVQLGTDSLFASGIVLEDSTVTDTTKAVSGLAEGTKYFWRVRTKNVSGVGAWSTVANFRTIVPLPGAVILASPNANSVVDKDTVLLVWHKGTPEATKYEVLHGPDSLFVMAVRDSNVTDTAKVMKPLLNNTRYFWKVRAKNAAGWGPYSEVRGYNTIITSVGDKNRELPKEFVLLQNYPNPFNPSTRIEYGVPQSSHVRLEVYNMLGEKVATLVDGEQEAGYHQVVFDAKRFASGMYFYRLVTENTALLRKMLLVK